MLRRRANLFSGPESGRKQRPADEQQAGTAANLSAPPEWGWGLPSRPQGRLCGRISSAGAEIAQYRPIWAAGKVGKLLAFGLGGE
jgi:hypothetical protein